jgi:hypothetical protein
MAMPGGVILEPERRMNLFFPGFSVHAAFRGDPRVILNAEFAEGDVFSQ